MQKFIFSSSALPDFKALGKRQLFIIPFNKPTMRLPRFALKWIAKQCKFLAWHEGTHMHIALDFGGYARLRIIDVEVEKAYPEIDNISTLYYHPEL